MLGWSNPHAPDVMFQGEWIDEAFENLHRSVVHLQVELFAVSEHLDDAAELFLFSGELQRVAQCCASCSRRFSARASTGRRRCSAAST
jgi:hypothetical protein